MAGEIYTRSERLDPLRPVSPENPLPVSVEGGLNPVTWKPTDFGSYTITDTAGSLFSFADSGSPASLRALSSATKCFAGTLETAGVRFRADGTLPTTTEGELFSSSGGGDRIILSLAELEDGRWVRATATNGVIKGHFYDVEPSVLIGAR